MTIIESFDHATPATHPSRVTDTVQRSRDTHSRTDLLIDMIRETHRTREDLLRARNRLLLQIKAICRRLVGGSIAEADVLFKSLKDRDFSGEDTQTAFGAVADLFPHLDEMAASVSAVEKRLKKMGAQLPIWEAWGKSINGFGEMGLAQIVGECGDLSNYENPAKLWKRMGLAVIDGERQQRKAGQEGITHGYSPRRRSVMWNIGEALFKHQNRFRDIYLQRKEYERQRAERDGLTVLPAAKISKLPAAERKQCISEGHIHNRAKRYMEKRLLRDLWQAWNA